MKIFNSQEERMIELKIKPNLKLIHEMKVNGYSDKYIAQALGVSLASFLKAITTSDVVKDVYNDAMMLLVGKLNDVVVKRALGEDGRLDKEGNLLPPDEKLAFKLLEKFDARYKQKIETSNVITIEAIIREAKKKEIEHIEDEEEMLEA